MLGLLSCFTSEQVLLNAIEKGRGKGKPASVFLVAEWQAAGWTHAWQMAFQRVFMNHLGCVQWLQTTLTTKPEGLLHKGGGGRGRAERKGGRKENQEVHKQTRWLFLRHRMLRIIGTFHHEPFHGLKQLLDYSRSMCVHSPTPSQATSYRWSFLLINSKL